MLMIHENSVMSTEVQRSGDISRHRERSAAIQSVTLKRLMLNTGLLRRYASRNDAKT